MSMKSFFSAAAIIAAVGGGYAALRSAGYVPSHGCCHVGDPTSVGATEPGPQPASDDKQLAEVQGYCPVMADTKLGEMGAPVKFMVKDKDGKEEEVFVCCKGCKRTALANPDKTLAKVAELKAAVATKR